MSDSASLELTFLGHAAFALRWHGLRVCVDPHKPGALGGRFDLPPIRGPFDHVVTTHSHEDHCAWTPELGAAPWHDGDGALGPIRLRVRPAFHDTRGGTQMGLVRMVSLDDGHQRVVHAGDIAAWDDADIAWLAGTDVLLVPTGGTYTLDGGAAAAFVRAVRPRVAVPMHAADARVDLPLEPVDAFVAAWSGPVELAASPTWTLPGGVTGQGGARPEASQTRVLVLPAP